MNFSCKVTKDNEIKLCSDTFMPFQTMNIELRVKCDAQHDGRDWSSEWVEHCHRKLTDQIVKQLGAEVYDFVGDVKPFAVHCHYGGKN